MSLFLSIVIGILLILLTLRLIKSKSTEDVFMNIVIPMVGIITSMYSLLISHFDLVNIENIIYLIDMGISCIYLIVFFFFYIKNKKNK